MRAIGLTPQTAGHSSPGCGDSVTRAPDAESRAREAPRRD